MFILDVNYTADISAIDTVLQSHRDYLNVYYTKGLLLCSGPKNPRTGGIIIGLFKTREEVDTFIRNDPYTKHNVAEYTVTEFNPVMKASAIKELGV